MDNFPTNQHSAQPDGAQTFTLSRFTQLDKPRGKQGANSWDELCAEFAQCDLRPEKDGPLFSPAIYDPKKVYRAKDNVLAASCLVADCDESHTFLELCAIVKPFGCRTIIVSTHSQGAVKDANAHAPGEYYRVIFLLETSIDAAIYDDIWERFNLLFGCAIDASCKDISRAYYWPSHPIGDNFVFEVFEGDYLSIDRLPPLPEAPPVQDYTPETGTNGTGKPGTDFNSKATNEDTAQILEAHGWRVKRSQSQRWGATRPGKTGPDISGTIGHYGPGVLHVFSSNAHPFESGRAYPPFKVMALLEYNGDWSATAKALAARGYGEKRDNRSARAANAGQQRDEGQREGADPFDPFDPFGKPIDEQNIFFESAPKPLTVELRPVPSLELEMLPESLRDWVSDVAERLSCPVDFVAVPAMIGLGSLIGRIAIRPKRFDDWAVVPNLWGAIVGRPGSKKSPAASEATSFLERMQATALDRHARLMEENEAEAEINEAQKVTAKKQLQARAHKGASRAELKQIQAESAIEETESPTLKRYLVSDTTVEALGVTLQENPRGVLVNRDELTGWLNGLDKQGREMDKAFYLEAYNGTKRNFIYDRIGRGRLVIPHVCISLFGTIQPGPLTQVIKASGEKSKQRDGFISRFQLLVYPDSTPYKRVDRWPDHKAKDRAFDVFEFFDSIIPESIGATVGKEWELPYLRFDAEAQQFFDEWLDGLEMQLAGGKETTLIEEHLSKYRSLMPSLAMVFHVADIADGAQPGPVSAHAAMMAAAWCQYLEAHARRVYGQTFDADTEALERLGERLTELPNPFNLSDLTRKKWSGLTNSEEVESLLIRLYECGWIVGGTVQTNGRPAKKFWVNPALLKEEKGGKQCDNS